MDHIKILAVDDSRLSRRRFLAEPLRKAGYEVIEAVDGNDGLRAVAEHNPDIIFSDLLMPEMDGFEFIAKLREQNAPQPIIVISADVQESTQEKLNQLQVFGFLNKPFKLDEMLAVVEKAIGSLCVER